jgi:hypothetical protein
MEVRRHRLLDRAVEGGEILVAEDAAGRPIGGGDSPGDIALVERVASCTNGRGAIVGAIETRLVGGGDGAKRPREVRLAEQFADLGDAAVGVVGLRRSLPLFGCRALAD